MSTELTSANLQALAATANAAHSVIEELAGTALEKAHEAGDALRQAKSLIPHGGWSSWLCQNFRGSARTAQLYMRIADRWPELEAKAQRVAGLPLRQAVALLESPRQTRREPAPREAGARAEQHPAVRGLALDPWQEPAFSGLLESIRTHGCIVPIVQDQHGFIIDGWLRYHACLITGAAYRVDVVHVADDLEAVELWTSYNCMRQHLTETQMVMVAKDLKELEALPCPDPEVQEAQERLIGALRDLDATVQAADWATTDPAEAATFSRVADQATATTNAAMAFEATCLKRMADCAEAEP